MYSLSSPTVDQKVGMAWDVFLSVWLVYQKYNFVNLYYIDFFRACQTKYFCAQSIKLLGLRTKKRKSVLYFVISRSYFFLKRQSSVYFCNELECHSTVLLIWHFFEKMWSSENGLMKISVVLSTRKLYWRTLLRTHQYFLRFVLILLLPAEKNRRFSYRIFLLMLSCREWETTKVNKTWVE